MKFSHCSKGLLAGAALLASGFANAIPVDTELVLLVDVSGSVDNGEFALQRDGYANSFRSDAFLNAVTSGVNGSIAVSYVYWSSFSQQQVTVGFTEIFDSASANAFADAIVAAPRPFSGGTSPAPAIALADASFDDNGFEGLRTVIDISGDGTGNASATRAARDAFLAGGGSAINTIGIQNQFAADFLAANAQGGDGSFSQFASSFSDFQTAVETKLVREVTSEVPEPSSVLLLAAGLIGVGVARRRRARG